MRAVQAHQEAVKTARTFQDLADNSRSSQEEEYAKGGDVAGDIDGEIHLKMAKMKTCYWF